MPCQNVMAFSPSFQHSRMICPSTSQGKSSNPMSRSFTCTPMAVISVIASLTSCTALSRSALRFARGTIFSNVPPCRKTRCAISWNSPSIVSAVFLPSIAVLSNDSSTGSSACASSRLNVFSGMSCFILFLPPSNSCDVVRWPIMHRGRQLRKRRSSSEHRIVARRTHEEQQRKRHPEADSPDQETLSCQAGGLFRHGLPRFAALARPANQLLIDAPDHAPHVQHHHPAQPPANPDRQQPVALPPARIEMKEAPCPSGQQNHVQYCLHGPFVEYAFPGKHQDVLDDPHHRPDQEKTAVNASSAGVGIVRIRNHDLAPVPESHQHRQ